MYIFINNIVILIDCINTYNKLYAMSFSIKYMYVCMYVFIYVYNLATMTKYKEKKFNFLQQNSI